MDYLKRLETVEDITEELARVVEEEKLLDRSILFNLTGSQDYYDISGNGEAAKANAIEYNEIVASLRTLGSTVNR